MIELIPIKDEASWLERRKNFITSTESASLFGLQMPSLPTAFELWHIKRGLIDGDIVANSRMIWGRRLEDVIAKGIAEDEGWKISELNVFAEDSKAKMGSSFDYMIVCPAHGPALLEVKTIAYRDYAAKFIEDDDGDFIEAPPYYEVQVQHQLECLPDHNLACLAVFIMDTREYVLLWREQDKDMGRIIRNKIDAFWRSTEPPPPDLEKDSDLLASLHRANSKDKSYDATENGDFLQACLSYEAAKQKAKEADIEKKVARSEIILGMGDSNTAWCDGFKVANKKQFRVTQLGE